MGRYGITFHLRATIEHHHTFAAVPAVRSPSVYSLVHTAAAAGRPSPQLRSSAAPACSCAGRL